MQPNDQYIRNIVRQEIASASNGSRFGITPTSNHAHTGIDSPQINGGNIIPGLRTTGTVEFDSAKSYKFNVNFQPNLVVFYGNPYHNSAGVITSVAINNGGTGYSLGDILTITSGSGGKAKVTSVSGSTITAVTLSSGGSGYTTSTQATTGGHGTGATVDIVATGSTSIDRHTFVFGQAALGQNQYFQPDTTSSVKIGGASGVVQSSTMFLGLGSGSTSSFQTIASQTHLINVVDTGTVVARATVSSYGQNYFTITVDTLSAGWVIVGNYFVM